MTLQSSSTQVTSLEGKVAVVTGGSGGIGSVICGELIERGAEVVIGDISDRGHEVAAGYNKEYVKSFQNMAITKHSFNLLTANSGVLM